MFPSIRHVSLTKLKLVLTYNRNDSDAMRGNEAREHEVQGGRNEKRANLPRDEFHLPSTRGV